MISQENLITLEQGELLKWLGAVSIALIENPHSIDLDRLGNNDALQAYLGDDSEENQNFALDLGRRILRRTSVKLHAVICGEDGDASAQELKDAFSTGKATATATLCTALLSVGAPPAIAIIISAILVNALADATHEELCSLWSAYNQQL